VTRTLLDSFTILGLIYESQFWKLDSRCVIFATVLWFDSFAVLIRFAFLMMRVNGWLLIDNRRNSGCSVLKCWVGISKQFPRIPWSGKEALQSSYYWINESKIIYYLKIVPWGTGHEYRHMIYFGNNFSSIFHLYHEPPKVQWGFRIVQVKYSGSPNHRICFPIYQSILYLIIRQRCHISGIGNHIYPRFHQTRI